MIGLQHDYALAIELEATATLKIMESTASGGAKGMRTVGRTDRVEERVQAHTLHKAVLIVHKHHGLARVPL